MPDDVEGQSQRWAEKQHKVEGQPITIADLERQVLQLLIEFSTHDLLMHFN